MIHWISRWVESREPLSRADKIGLIGFGFGLVGWVLGSHGFLSHLGALAAGMCLGQVVRDRQQRAHERRMAEIKAKYDAAMAGAKLLLVGQFRRCPRCERVTWNPTDINEGYCGACHDWT